MNFTQVLPSSSLGRRIHLLLPFPDWLLLQQLLSLFEVSVFEVQCHSALHLASNRLEHIMRCDTWFWQRGGGSGRPQTDLAADFPTGAGELRSDSPKGHQMSGAARVSSGTFWASLMAHLIFKILDFGAYKAFQRGH